jgi:pimeloyl-CoA synthetase
MIQNLSLSSESVVLTPACINHLCLSEIIKETTGWLDGNKMGAQFSYLLVREEVVH